MRTVPDDNLAYPALVSLASGAKGSGFFLNTSDSTYFITALHVLFKLEDRTLISPTAEVLSYSKDPKESKANRLSLDLTVLQNNGNIFPHLSHDVVAIKIAAHGGPAEPKVLTLLPGAVALETTPLGVTGVALTAIKRFAEVLVANDIVLFGYPSSLGMKHIPQLQANRPLLRKGIVAGLNQNASSIVLDCPVYPGNSGGPVIEIEPDGFSTKYRVIGVVSQFVPYAETWLNTVHGYSNTTISNSGYSIAVPMDFVLDLITH